MGITSVAAGTALFIEEGRATTEGVAATRCTTPAGHVCIAFTDAGIVMAERAGDLDAFARRCTGRMGSAPQRVDEPPQWLKVCVARWNTGNTDIAWRFDLRGLSPFAQAVLRATYEIPRGQTRTYGEVAAASGHPGAARAVGTVMANNPLPLFIPCHRVVRSSGNLGNYSSGGIAVKDALLRWERGDRDALALLESL
jgi:methylated-DNA-[protein]-cysteine S-methyltransferase